MLKGNKTHKFTKGGSNKIYKKWNRIVIAVCLTFTILFMDLSFNLVNLNSVEAAPHYNTDEGTAYEDLRTGDGAVTIIYKSYW